MIKIGDRVTLWNNLTREGVVLQLREEVSKTWFVGGVASTSLHAKVHWDGEEAPPDVWFPVSKLMRLE